MNVRFIAITEGAAEYILGHASATLEPPFVPIVDTSSITYRDFGNGTAVLASRLESRGARFAVIDCSEIATFPSGTTREVFARILRAIRATARFPIRLPASWSEYHHHALIAFFALPRSFGNYRWVAKVDAEQSAILFLKVTSAGKPVVLENYQGKEPPSLRLRVDEVIASSPRPMLQKDSKTFVDKVDFDAIGGSAISRSWSVETWDTHLTREQKRVRDLASGSNIRIVGPAGSGKTLALCVRALFEARRATKEGRSMRVLFATHSWAMAERVDDTLRILNGGESVAEITVYPLLQVLKEVLGASYASGLNVLGQDSTEGRKRQFDLLSEALSSISVADKAVLSAQRLSTHVVAALAAAPMAVARLELLEDLYEEINGFLLAEGLLPGDRKREEDYLTQERPDELPPFVLRGDRALVLLVYRHFLTKLRDWGFVTTDQLVSDAIKILETFSWSVRRETEGYDLILIDELQLFDAQERFALQLLTTSPETAAFVTAEDPSQGIFSAIAPQWRREVATKRNRESVELGSPHRFSEGILSFVTHLYRQFPLNAQAFPIEPGTDPALDSPVLIRTHSREACIDRVAALARDRSSELKGDERLAVICLDGSSPEIAEALRRNGQNVTLIQSLDDVEQLTYSRRTAVVGEWQFLGGTQFTDVIATSCAGSIATSTFGRIRELTALYVAASRASRRLALVIAGRAHPEIESAQEQELLRAEANEPS